MKRWKIALIVAVAALVAYGNSVFHGFVYDDDLSITDCELITSLSHLGGLFTQDYFNQTIEMSWRPLVTLTHFFEFAVFGSAPWGYHLTNILLHAATAVGVWWLLSVLIGGWIAPLIAALIFAVHPLASEAVNAISFREDLLVGVFAAPALLLARRALSDRSIVATLGACLCIFLACLAKESGAVLVPCIALWWWLTGGESLWKGIRSHWILWAALAATMIVWGALRFVLIVPENPIPVPHWGGDVATALWNFPRIFFHGLWLTVWPPAMSADYEWEAMTFGQGSAIWIGWVTLIGWGVGIALTRRRAPLLGLGMGWWLLGLLPVSNLVPLSNPVADRYLYLPLMGWALSLGWAINAVEQSMADRPINVRRFVWAAWALVGVALLNATVYRNLVWGDAERLWTATLQVEPRSTTALNNLGCIRLQQGKPAEAETLLLRGMAVNPEDTDLVNNYGIAMTELGRWDEALRAFEWSVDRMPADPVVRWRYALSLSRAPDPQPQRAWDQMLIAEQLGYPIPDAFRSDLASRVSTPEVRS